MFQSVAIQWLIRRIPEYGAIFGSILAVVLYAPPDVTGAFQAILTGQGGGLTVTTYISVISWVYAQVISFRATNKAQAVVLEDGKLVTNTLAPKKEKEVAEVVTNVNSGKTLLDIILGK